MQHGTPANLTQAEYCIIIENVVISNAWIFREVKRALWEGLKYYYLHYVSYIN